MSFESNYRLRLKFKGHLRSPEVEHRDKGSNLVRMNSYLKMKLISLSSEAKGLRDLGQTTTSSGARGGRDPGQPITSSEARGSRVPGQPITSSEAKD